MGFPLTKMVKVSSFSVVIKFPNQDRLVNSGDDSGVKCTSSAETEVDSKERLSLSSVTGKSSYIPCIFLRWNRGLPKKLFLMLVSRVFQSCPPGVLQGEPGIPGLLLFIMGDPLGFTTARRERRADISSCHLCGVEGYHNGSTGHAHTTIRVWIVEHTNGNCRT